MGSVAVQIGTDLCSRIEGVKKAVSFTNLGDFTRFAILLGINKDGE